MDRYTRKDAEKAVSRLAAALGRPTEGEGSYYLHHAYQQGYSIYEQSGPGASEPFGSTLRSARELCETVNFALRAIGINHTARVLAKLS